MVRKFFDAEKSYNITMDYGDLSDFQGIQRNGGATSLSYHKEVLLKLLNENQERYSHDNINRIRMLLSRKTIYLSRIV